jgi:multidrug efflux system outer membrane protein
MKRKLGVMAALWIVLLALSGCLNLGPKYRRPQTGVQVPPSYQHARHPIAVSKAQDRWWQAFGDPQLNQLVDTVLKTNWDIRAATAKILEVRAQFVQARADRFPRVDFQAGAERRRFSTEVAIPNIQIGPGGMDFQMTTERRVQRTSNHNLSLAASFELDLWGKLARSEEASLADLLGAEENRRTVAQTVVAEAVSLYLQQEALERRIAISNKSIEVTGRSLELVERRYKRGLTSILDVRQARRTLAQAEASLPPLRQELGIIQQNLAVLLGRYPKTHPPRPQPDDYFNRLAPVPSGLPSELLLRRPDIRAAEARLKALNARVGVAKASRFPRITLTGSFGYSSDPLRELFSPESYLWSVAVGLARHVFDAGKLKAAQRAAEARYLQGVTEYAKTVLGAFSEVEGALLTRKRQLERRDRVVRLVQEARETQRVAQSRYLRGLTDYLTVLEAQVTRFQAEDTLVLVDLAILTNRVALHRALGGGWARPAPADGEKAYGPSDFLGF